MRKYEASLTNLFILLFSFFLLEPLRTKVLKSQGPIEGTDGKLFFEGRPGADLQPFDFDAEQKKLEEKWGADSGGLSGSASSGVAIRDVDVVSSALYPSVFDDFMSHQAKYVFFIMNNEIFDLWHLL